jgi:hypothetical protein
MLPTAGVPPVPRTPTRGYAGTSNLTRTGMTTTRIDEIAPDVFRISTYLPASDLSFNQFLARCAGGCHSDA